MQPKSSFLKIMQERGFIADCTDLAALDEALMQPGQKAYVGYDLTATSLHVGHLMNIMAMRWFADCGHEPLLLTGRGTTMVGDPSFRNTARPMLPMEEIDANAHKIRSSLVSLMDGRKHQIVDNADWINEVSLMNFLRNIGSQFTVNKMLSFESVKGRLKDGGSISLIEFCYMTLQAWDFDMLSLYKGCILQMGGSDQWGNIVNGVELVRKRQSKKVFGLTTPLLTNSSGQKMGKTANGAVWLNAEQMSPYDFWQFWRNVDDADVGRFLKLFTTLPVELCEQLGAAEGAQINASKAILADHVTTMVHGEIAALDAGAQAAAVFRGTGGADQLPQFDLSVEDARLAKALVAIGFARSGKEARRAIEAGEVRVNGAMVTEAGAEVQSRDVIAQGKRRQARVVVKG